MEWPYVKHKTQEAYCQEYDQVEQAIEELHQEADPCHGNDFMNTIVSHLEYLGIFLPHFLQKKTKKQKK